MNSCEFDVIVVGAGHAGLEAAFIAGRFGLKVALFNMNRESVANLPCNPSAGGPAKGVVIREIDALGGIQAIAVDECKIQIKKVNGSKGPGVWAYRAQVDRSMYHNWFIDRLNNHPNISLILDEVIDVIWDSGTVQGVVAKEKGRYYSKSVIITTGTYLRSEIYRDVKIADSGPDNFPASNELSDCLKKMGIDLIRLKTGTSPRVYSNSIDFSKLEKDDNNDENLSFSFISPKKLPLQDQFYCYLAETTEDTRRFVLNNIENLGTYNGSIVGTGPRYCPSIEDKFIKFPHREKHHIFVEPVSKDCDYVYLAGLSTSLKKELQEQLLRTIRGFENANICKYAYSIVYDAINPINLKKTLEHKKFSNLYFAGQLNGTSGYEEAAAQGLVAGINAALKILGKSPFIMRRDESYIGVMIDDLTSRGIREPYRLLTSRAEYRLLLRNDNADVRLMHKAYELGTVDEKTYLKHRKIFDDIKWNIEFLKKNFASRFGLTSGEEGPLTLFSWLSREGNEYGDVLKVAGDKLRKLDDFSIEKLMIEVKYEGYIKNQQSRIDKVDKWKKLSLINISDYSKIVNLSREAIEKLNLEKPITIEDALRIDGININDIFWVKAYLDGGFEGNSHNGY